MRIFACMASTVDGKIGPAGTETFVPIGSRHDMEHLMSIRDQADGVIFGAGTFRAWPKAHRGLNRRRVLRHYIMSNRLDLDPGTPLLQDSSIPATVFSSLDPLPATSLPEHVQIIQIPEAPESLPAVIRHIESQGVENLLLEGGGILLQQFIEAGQLQELYLTLVPSILGEQDAPALLGNRLLSHPVNLEVLDQKTIQDEVYIHLRITQ